MIGYWVMHTGDMDILDLTKIEQKVLKVLLSGESQSVADIHKKSKVGYTSVKAVLIRLRERGLVQKHQKGKRFEWKLSGRKKINREISEVLSYTHSGEVILVPEEKAIDFNEALNIQLFSGLDDMIKIIKESFSLHKAERLLVIESRSSTIDILKKVPIDVINTVNEVAYTHQIITEDIISEGVLNELRYLVEKEPSWAPSALGRTFDMRVVSSEVLDNLKGNLAIYRDVVLITDWDKETLIRIKNREAVELFTILFRALQETGKKIHVSEALK